MFQECGLDGQALPRILLVAVKLEGKGVDEPIVLTDISEANRAREVELSLY